MNSDLAVWIVMGGLIVCALGLTASCDSDCRSRGGVLVKGIWGNYECIQGAPRR